VGIAIDASKLAVIDAARFRDASPDEFADLVEPHLAQMGRLAERLCGVADRDDVVQDALLRAWTKRAQFEPRRGALASWLLAITFDQARRRHRSVRRSIQIIGSPTHSGEDRLDLERAVARLSSRQRLAVDCYYFVGLSISETAAVMGCSEGTVKSTLSDARGHLRLLLGGNDDRS
jgi:RNA polymerase sigma factor (sigma-70 family)